MFASYYFESQKKYEITEITVLLSIPHYLPNTR